MSQPPNNPTRKPETKIFAKVSLRNIWNLFMVPDHQIMNYDVERDNSNDLWRLCNSELTNATVPSILKLNNVVSRSKKWKFWAPPFFSKLIGNNHVQMWASWWDTPHPSRNNKHSSLLLVQDTFRWRLLSLFTTNYWPALLLLPVLKMLTLGGEREFSTLWFQVWSEENY